MDQFERYGAEFDRTSHLVSALSLKYNLSISRVFMQEQEWLKGQTPLMRNVRTEAVAAVAPLIGADSESLRSSLAQMAYLNDAAL